MTIKKIGSLIWTLVYLTGTFIGTLCILPFLIIIALIKITIDI